MSEMQTLAANLEKAARDKMPAHIGGGEFSPQECARLAAIIRASFTHEGRAAFSVAVAGFPVSLFQESRDRFRVEYGADISRRLDYEGAALKLGAAIMHGLTLEGKLSGTY